MRKKSIFFNKNGEPSVYSFLCGYVKEWELTRDNSTIIQLTLWQEHTAYNVRSHNFETHTRLRWECFDKLPKARKEFNRQKREIQAGILR